MAVEKQIKLLSLHEKFTEELQVQFGAF